MCFSKEDCVYTKFNIENHKIDFADSGNGGILISIPFMDDTPYCIKDKINHIIYQEMNKYLKTVECMSIPCNLVLNARMQVQCCNDGGLVPQYYISIVITDIPEINYGTWIEKTVNINSESIEFRNEFISYCRYQLDKVLFPVCKV